MDEVKMDKKSSFEHLSKAELVKKCKQYLGIAQKAKQAKDELLEENERLTKELNQTNEKNQLNSNTFEEMVNVLTQQKLKLVTDSDALLKEKQDLQNKVQRYEHMIMTNENNIDSLQTQLECCRRQISRLKDENEKLIQDVSESEKEIQQLIETVEVQHDELISLRNGSRKSVISDNSGSAEKFLNNTSCVEDQHVTDVQRTCDKDVSETEVLHTKINELECLVKSLQEQLNYKQDSIDSLHNQNIDLLGELNVVRTKLEDNDSKCESLKVELEESRKMKQLYIDKLKSFRDKLIKQHVAVKELKQEKMTLLTLASDFSGSIEKWKVGIENVAVKYKEEIETLQSKVNILENEKSDLLSEKNELIQDMQRDVHNLEGVVRNTLESFTKQIKFPDIVNNKLLQYDDKLGFLAEKISLFNSDLVNRHNGLIKENDEKNEIIARLKDENKELLNAADANKKELECLNGLKDSVFQLKEEKKQLFEVVKSRYSNADYERLIQSEQSIRIVMEDLIDECNDLKMNLERMVDDLDSKELLLTKKQNEIDKLFDTFKQEKSDLLATIEDYKNKLEKRDKMNTVMSNNEPNYPDIKNQVQSLKRENVELLKEMNDMNEALKERGETISKQQEHGQELLKRIANLEQELGTYKKNLNLLEEENKQLKSQAVQQNSTSMADQSVITDSAKKIKALEQEVQQLRDVIANNAGRESQDAGYGDSETMSTSTVSRTDEAARLRDLEGSWEERYSKLRSLALKQKSKIKELTEQLNQERNEKTEIQNKLTTTTRNLQTVQTECDRINDQCELLYKESKTSLKKVESLSEELNKVQAELNSTTEMLSKTKADLENIKKIKTNSDLSIREYINQMNYLKKEVESIEISKCQLEGNINKLENLLKLKESELEKEIKAHNACKEQLLKYDKEIKKNSVLSLEMEDYERSLKELSAKLDKKNELIKDLEEDKNKQELEIKILQEELGSLREEINNYEGIVTSMKNNALKTSAKISEYEAVISQKDNRIREIMRSLEEQTSANESLNNEMSSKFISNQKLIDTLREENKYILSQKLGLEDKAKEMFTCLQNKNMQLEELEKEYEKYKVRAQSVLRQNQTRDVAVEERLREELGELKTHVTVALEELEDTKNKLAHSNKLKELIERESAEKIKRFSEIEKLLEKEKTENHLLQNRIQQMIEEHKSALRNQKVHMDTLTLHYKQQIAELQEKHAKEITELRSIRQNSSIDHNLEQTAHNYESHTETFAQRDENDSMPLSLDKLLSMDVDNISATDYESQLLSCKKRLSEYEAKVTHLTAVLAETEQDLVKHTHLNEILKEDIRRHQRSEEREKHAENLEYLKNVVFKFLTLKHGEEKSRLIPVLNTILKLSPEETQKLTSVAKGAESGWGSLLPIWGASNQ